MLLSARSLNKKIFPLLLITSHSSLISPFACINYIRVRLTFSLLIVIHLRFGKDASVQVPSVLLLFKPLSHLVPTTTFIHHDIHFAIGHVPLDGRPEVSMATEPATLMRVWYWFKYSK